MRVFGIILLIFNIFAFIYNCWIKHTLMIDEIASIIFLILFLIGV